MTIFFILLHVCVLLFHIPSRLTLNFYTKNYMVRNNVEESDLLYSLPRIGEEVNCVIEIFIL